MGEGKENTDIRDGWTRDFDPACNAVNIKLVRPTKNLTWDEYVAEPKVKSQLQRLCSQVSGFDGSSHPCTRRRRVFQKIRQVTRGTFKAPDPKTAHHRVVLLHGPPGCGKNQAARVMASVFAKKRSNFKVYHVDLSFLKKSWYNHQSEHQQLQRVLKHIEKLKNAIVFIDKVDSMFVGETSRHRDVPNSNLPRTEFLPWIHRMDTQSNNNLTLICATTSLDACDPALLSQFSLQVEIPPPSPKLRRQWWDYRARHLKPLQREKLASCQVDSFRILEQLIQEAEEASAYALQKAPCYADYKTRLDKFELSSDGGQNNQSVPKMADLARYGQLVAAQPYAKPEGMDPTVRELILSQTKSIDQKVEEINPHPPSPTTVVAMFDPEESLPSIIAEESLPTILEGESPCALSSSNAGTLQLIECSRVDRHIEEAVWCEHSQHVEGELKTRLPIFSFS